LAVQENQAKIWRFGIFEVEASVPGLRRSGVSVKIREQPFRVLVYLLEHAGEMVSREDLRRVLWPADTFVDFDHSLNTAMMNLRDVLGDVADAPIYIETIPKRGYRFIAAVRAIHPNGVEAGMPGAMGPAPIQEAGPTETAGQGAVAGTQTPTRRQWWYLGIGAVLLVVVASVAFVRIWRAGRSASSMTIEQRLTANPPEAPITAASISPDGKYVAYSDPTGVYLRPMEGGETRPLSLPQGSNAAPAGWFPDGIHVLVDIEGTETDVPSLWKISILGGSPQKIVENARGGLVSPNGLRIAFLRTASGVFEIWTADNDGSNPKRMVEDAGPDDLMGIGGILTHPLYSGLISRLAWSPDGNRIAYIRGFAPTYIDLATENRCALETVDTNDGTRKTLMDSAQLRPAVAWSADGRLLYAYRDDAGGDRSDIGIWAVRLNQKSGAIEGALRQLTSGAGRIGGINVTADGKQLVLWRSNTQPTVFVSDLDPRTRQFKIPHRLTLDENGNVAAAWTPDSRAVLFASNRDGNWKLFRQAIDQTTPEVVADGGRGRNFIFPRMNPDGTEILYLAPYDLRNPEPLGDVMSVALQGGAQRVVLRKSQGNIQCARAPSRLCLVSERAGSTMNISSFDPEKGTKQEFGTFKIDDNLNWSISPDGTQLAMLPVPGSEITFMTLADKRTHSVELRGVRSSNVDWTGGGKSVYVTAKTSHGTDEVIEVEPSGTNHVVLESDNHTHFWWAIQSPDGQHIIVQAVTGENNVWVVDNF
jgi:Tol biopolymer transport system component/DNA-binding winged helix-turn-helix (wHTH) protein